MKTDIVERVRSLEREAEHLEALHFGAMRVMDSTRDGGWGTFRIDGLTDELADRLPDYVKGFEGNLLPQLFYGEEDELKQGGGILVDERHSRFKQVAVEVDDTTGETQRLFRWDRELWDYEAAEAEVQVQQRTKQVESRNRWGRRAAVAAFAVSEIVGFGLAFKGAEDRADLIEQNAPQAQIESADTINEVGQIVMLGGHIAASTAAVVLIVKPAREALRVRKKNA